MASSTNMLYQEGYFPPVPPAQQTDSRRRSSSYTDRYRPRNYSNPPPQQPEPNLLGPYQQSQTGVQQPHQVPLPMSNPASPYQQPPYPTGDQALVPRYDMPLVPQRQLADELPPRPAVTYPEGLRRASYDAAQMRRSSHDSRRSHHSGHSHHSHRPRYEEDDLDGEEYDSERERRHHHHHHHHHHEKKDDIGDMDTFRQKKRDRGDVVSRSFGDSLLSVFGQPIKWLMEPRDKY